MYNGWTLTDSVILVLKKDKYNQYCGHPQGYVVNPSDKKMLERAKSWGQTYERVGNDENGKAKYETVEPEVVTLENKGFTLELMDSAHGSSQGGKLSFWNCLITHGDIKAVVGINANLLLCLLKQSDFHDGKCLNQLSFARNTGEVGLLHAGMKEYKEALSDKQLKEKMKKGKTTKWQVGNHYKTATIDDIYLGKFYKPLVGINFEYSSTYQIGKKLKELLGAEQYKELVTGKPAYETTYVDLYKLKLDKENQAHVAYTDVMHTDNLDRFSSEKLKDLENTLDYISIYAKTPSRTCETGKYAVAADAVRSTLIEFLNKLRNNKKTYASLREIEKLSVTDTKEYSDRYVDNIIRLLKSNFRDGGYSRFVIVIETPEESYATIDKTKALEYIKNYLSN